VYEDGNDTPSGGVSSREKALRRFFHFSLDFPPRDVKYLTCDWFNMLNAPQSLNGLHGNALRRSWQQSAGGRYVQEVTVDKNVEKTDLKELTRRERQIMEIVYQLGRATAIEVMANLPGRPANATVRTMLNVLEEKGYLRHETEKGKFIYIPTIPLASARKTALDNVLETFFRGAEASAVISILTKADANLTEEERKRILEIIEESRKGGR
jgi:predicted transcriptional regulator